MRTLTEYERYKPLLERIEKRGNAIERVAVVNEALSWMGTAFHMNARVKKRGDDKGGVDCGEFLIAVYSAVGLMPDYEPDFYSPQFHLHNPSGPEKYVEDVLRFAHETEGPPEAGDFALFHLGRHYAHSAIVVDWPERVVHAPANMPGGVQLGDASRDSQLLRGGRRFPPKFFSVWS